MYRRDHENDESVGFETLKGKTIEAIRGLEKGSEQFFIDCTDGTKFKMTYYQDCCACCDIEDISGDINDVIGSEILLAEEVSSFSPSDETMSERAAEYQKYVEACKAEGTDPWYDSLESFLSYRYKSETWTFYKLSTIKGSVTIRWYGSSNGYYSEEATFEQISANKPRIAQGE